MLVTSFKLQLQLRDGRQKLVHLFLVLLFKLANAIIDFFGQIFLNHTHDVVDLGKVLCCWECFSFS